MMFAAHTIEPACPRCLLPQRRKRAPCLGMRVAMAAQTVHHDGQSRVDVRQLMQHFGLDPTQSRPVRSKRKERVDKARRMVDRVCVGQWVRREEVLHDVLIQKLLVWQGRFGAPGQVPGNDMEAGALHCCKKKDPNIGRRRERTSGGKIFFKQLEKHS